MIADIDGMRLYYDVRGEGEPLLLVHGGMGCGRDWQYVFPADPSGYRIIAPDLRGHGQSTNPLSEFTFRRTALDMLALLDELGIERVKAIGLSGGGITLLHMATLQPARVASMIAVSAPPYFPDRAKAIQLQYSDAMLSDAERQAMSRRHAGGAEQLRTLFGYVRSFATNDDDVHFTPALLATITADTLIVFGDRDFLYPVSIAFELHAAIPRSYLWIVPNGGHGPIFGPHAPRFVETATAFLSGAWKQP